MGTLSKRRFNKRGCPGWTGKKFSLKISWHQHRILVRLVIIINVQKMPPERSLGKHRKKWRNERIQLKASVLHYSIFRSDMKFKSKMKILNHIIYSSIWKPNRSGHPTFFGNFCFLEPLALCLGSKTWTGWYEMCCKSVEREKCFVLHYSLTFPLILGLGVVEITQDFSLCL